MTIQKSQTDFARIDAMTDEQIDTSDIAKVTPDQMATAVKCRTITLTDAAPVRIREDQWPEIASGKWTDYDGQNVHEANRTWKLWVKVRRHEDGRTIVYGGYMYDSQFQNEANISSKGGELLYADADIIAAIRRVGSSLGEAHEDAAVHEREVVQECIADLPAVDLE